MHDAESFLKRRNFRDAGERTREKERDIVTQHSNTQTMAMRLNQR